MRGPDEQAQHMFSYLSPEQRVPADHPLRAIRALTDGALRSMSPQFDRLYSAMGRPSVPPEQLLRALLLHVLYTVRSERLLMEELDYNLLFRWFVPSGHRDYISWCCPFRNASRLLSSAEKSLVSHSQTTSDSQPSVRSAVKVLRSRSTLASRFSFQNATLVLGVTLPYRQSCTCQKRPCTKISFRRDRKTRSGRPRTPF